MSGMCKQITVVFLTVFLASCVTIPWPPTPGPTPPPEPPPPPAGVCPIPEDVLEPAASQPPAGDHHAEVKAATTKLGSLPGMTPPQKLRALADQLVEDTGWCWFAGLEAIFVIREDGYWGEYHAVSFGGGGWTNSGNGKWMGKHADPRVTEEGLSFPDPREESMRFSIHAQPNKIDTTLTVFNALEYCRAIRMGKHGDLPRAACPVRPEGHPERLSWERAILGNQTHTCNGEPMPYWNGNPAVAAGTCRGTYETCSEDGRICSSKEL